LYTNNEDIDSIKEGVKEMAKMDPQIKAIVEADPFDFFLNLCKKNLHIVLTMSPIGEDFKRRLRMFPSLVNCCTIDWFLPWPKEALESVAHQFLAETELEHKEGIINICVDMQERVRDLSVRFYEELRSHYYVTPTSYLELIKTFQKLLGKKRTQVDLVINKFKKGFL
jgi:dynein heavy chain